MNQNSSASEAGAPSPSSDAAAVPQEGSLRVARHWHWVPVSGGEFRVGGKVPLELVHSDVLETLVDGRWVPVPVVDMGKPEHPDVIKERERMKLLQEAMDESALELAQRMLAKRKPLAEGQDSESGSPTAGSSEQPNARGTSRGYTDQFRLPDTLPPTDDKGG